MNAKTALMLAAAFVAGACATWRWSGSGATPSRDALHPPPVDAPGPEIDVPPVRERSAARPAAVPLPEPNPAKRARAIYSSDLGPDELDVSGYPAQQRFNYAVFAAACSRCHDLSRTLYAPRVAKGWWEFYVAGMRVRARLEGKKFTADEIKASLDFLAYDGATRKRTPEFESQVADLDARFAALVDERMEKLQKTAPKIPKTR